VPCSKDVLTRNPRLPPYQLYRRCGSGVISEEAATRLDDFTTPERGRATSAAAERFERIVEKRLRTSMPGCRFKTQADLMGSRVTPDFLFDQPLVLDDSIVLNWIDAKNSFGGDNKFTLSRLRKQGDKYNEAFGHGAFLFRYSFSEVLPQKLDDRYTLISWRAFRSILRRKRGDT
jgi:hypothetical protein